MRWEIKNLAENIVNVALLILTLFLTGRVVFQLLSANPSTPFVSWVYNVSAYFMTPFRGIFDSVNLPGGVTIDIPALFSLAAYAVLGFIIVYLIRTLTRHLTHSDVEEEEHIHDRPQHREAHAHSH